MENNYDIIIECLTNGTISCSDLIDHLYKKKSKSNQEIMDLNNINSNGVIHKVIQIYNLKIISK